MDRLELLNNLIEAIKTNKMSREEAFDILIADREKELAEDAKKYFLYYGDGEC